MSSERVKNNYEEILVKQRLQRPIAPHLGIYKWQITSVLSSLERITGVLLSGGFYIFGATYLVSPYLSWDLSSTSMAAAFGALPVVAKAAIKFCVAWPFAFHCINGVKYLVWDTGRGLSNRKVIVAGWAVVGATTLSSIVLALWV